MAALKNNAKQPVSQATNNCNSINRNEDADLPQFHNDPADDFPFDQTDADPLDDQDPAISMGPEGNAADNDGDESGCWDMAEATGGNVEPALGLGMFTRQDDNMDDRSEVCPTDEEDDEDDVLKNSNGGNVLLVTVPKQFQISNKFE